MAEAGRSEKRRRLRPVHGVLRAGDVLVPTGRRALTPDPGHTRH
nr:MULTISPECIES: hypothetical protein [unclassified Streptomyces]